MRVPDQQFIKNLCEDLKHWEELLNQVAEKFTGETLLSREDELYNMNRQVDEWTDVALKVLLVFLLCYCFRVLVAVC